MKKNKLHPAVKNKWLKALRSGEYEQTTDVLRRPGTGGMCCIGVLCAIYGADEVYLDENVQIPSDTLFDKGILPKSCNNISREDWAGLSGMNDGGKTFTTIANYIEENL